MRRSLRLVAFSWCALLILLCGHAAAQNGLGLLRQVAGGGHLRLQLQQPRGHRRWRRMQGWVGQDRLYQPLQARPPTRKL